MVDMQGNVISDNVIKVGMLNEATASYKVSDGLANCNIISVNMTDGSYTAFYNGVQVRLIPTQMLLS